MQVKHSKPTDTEAVLSVNLTDKELLEIKKTVLAKFAKTVKVPGFREGKAPLNMIEKQLEPSVFQSEFLEETINQTYPQAVNSEKLRVVGQPQISIKKFVPFDTLEFEATVPVIGQIKLPDYKKIKVQKPVVSVSAKDVDEVIGSLKKRMAEKKDVDRAAKDTDQVWIDFKGVDEKKTPVSGADGKDYPLVLGSNTFIPGFEENLVGLKPGDEKSFTLTFPKDYGLKAMANKKVTFTVNVKKVQEVVEPKVDDEFAKKAGPFESVKQLKEDIKKQLTLEKQNQVERDFESEIVRKITDKSEVAIPAVLIEEQQTSMLNEFKQNLSYRGQTYNEYLEAQGLTEEELIKKEISQQAEDRVKASLVLSEISEIEKIDLTMDEVNDRIKQLKAQYQDPAMRAELDKPENVNNIASRIVTEKTIAKLKDYCIQSK
jgi:trigger factor